MIDLTNEQVALLAATISRQNYTKADIIEMADEYLEWLNKKEINKRMKKKGVEPT